MKKGHTASMIPVFLLIWAPGFFAHSGELVNSFGKEKPVTLEDLRPHLEDMEGYTEQWNYNVYLKDDSFIAVDFGVTNLAVTSDHDGVMRAKFVDPGGKQTACQIELDDDQWKYGKTGFWLDFKKGKVQGDLKGADVTVRCKRLSMDLRFENLAPPYQPGGGALRFGKGDGIYRIVYPSPRARVTGTITVEGQKREIEGVGHAAHSHTNMRPDKQVHRWFRFKQIDQDITIVLVEMEATKHYFDSRNGWVLVYGPQGRLLATARARFEFDGFIKDQESQEGYQVPRRIRFAAVDGDSQMTGVLVMKKIEKTVDPLAEMGAIKRAVVRRYTKPREYHISCTYKFNLKVKDGSRTIQGDDKYRFIYVNP
jgi:hypothetical protein